MPRQTRRVRKRKQRGGTLTKHANNREKAVRNFVLSSTFQNKLANTTSINNGNYTNPKVTTIPVGTRFEFRSHEPVTTDKLQDRPMWLDYKKGGNPNSTFLLPNFKNNINNIQSLVSPQRPRLFWEDMRWTFGPIVNLVKTTAPLKVLHFPIDPKAPNGNRSVTSYNEPIIQALCIKKKEAWCQKYDGYTLDVFYDNTYIDFPLQKYSRNNPQRVIGHRELCLFHPVGKIKILGSYSYTQEEFDRNLPLYGPMPRNLANELSEIWWELPTEQKDELNELFDILLPKNQLSNNAESDFYKAFTKVGVRPIQEQVAKKIRELAGIEEEETANEEEAANEMVENEEEAVSMGTGAPEPTNYTYRPRNKR
jgi:hypothetical protein